MNDLQTTGQVTISFEYNRQLGPRFEHGAVTIEFDSMQPYNFECLAIWPVNNFEHAIRRGVEELLISKCGQLKKTKVIVKEIKWDPINSCEIGFYKAAKGATYLAFMDLKSLK